MAEVYWINGEWQEWVGIDGGYKRLESQPEKRPKYCETQPVLFYERHQMLHGIVRRVAWGGLYVDTDKGRTLYRGVWYIIDPDRKGHSVAVPESWVELG